MSGRPYVALVIGRVKKPDSFLQKAERADPDSRGPKYAVPLRDIQDQIGLRVIVRSPAAVRSAGQRLRGRWGAIQNEPRRRYAHPEYFGYEARHLICPLPDRMRRDITVHVFEIQVCTLFQFAWTEMEHDLGYKGGRLLSPQRRRIISSAAALAYAADRLFGEVDAAR